jgi:Zn-dependent protease with chaperone function
MCKRPAARATHVAARDVLVGCGMGILMVMAALLVASLAALPTWPYSANWGYYPTGVCGLLVTAIATLVVVGRL